MFSRFISNRPILAASVVVVLVLGGIAYIALLPEIPPPAVVVSAYHPGANAKFLAETVASPIEGQVNGVEGMTSMSSQCTDDGHYTLTVRFRPGTDLNIAQALVQTRESLAEPTLPEPVRRRGISVVNEPSPPIGPPLLSTVAARRAGGALLILLGIVSLGALGLLSRVLRLARKALRPAFAVDCLAGPACGKAIAAAFAPVSSNGHSSNPDGLRAVPARRADADALKE